MRITRNPARGSGGNPTYTPDSLPGYRGGGGGGAMTMDSLFGVDDIGDFFDFTDTSTMFQDAGGTTPADTIGDVVSLVRGNRTTGISRDLTGIAPLLTVSAYGIGGLSSNELVATGGALGLVDQPTTFCIGGRVGAGTSQSVQLTTNAFNSATSGASATLNKYGGNNAGVIVLPDTLLHSMANKGDGSTGNVFLDGVAVGGTVTRTNSTAFTRVALLYLSNANSDCHRMFYINRELNAEEFAFAEQWCRGAI